MVSLILAQRSSFEFWTRLVNLFEFRPVRLFIHPCLWNGCDPAPLLAKVSVFMIKPLGIRWDPQKIMTNIYVLQMVFITPRRVDPPCVGPLTTAEDEDFGLVFPSTVVRMIPLDTSWYKILKLPSWIIPFFLAATLVAPHHRDQIKVPHWGR